MSIESKYSVELVNPNGDLLADLSGRASGRKLTKSRNEADEINWSIDLQEFERYARMTNQDPKSLLIVDQTEVRIRRGQEYLGGGQINYARTEISADNARIAIKATGFLNLFKDRVTDIERTFDDVQATTIAWTLIDESQQLTNGDYGVTQGTLATVGTHDRTYRRTVIKDALQNLTRVQTNPFDFEFTYDKVFNTYASIGSNRPEIIFEYPNNIKSIGVPLDGTGIANQIIVLGSGFGEIAAAQVITDDLNSQLNYQLRQKVITPNSVQEEDTLTDHGNAELAAWAYPFEVPEITVDGNLPPYITDYGIGDYVRIRVVNHPWLSHIDRMYRLEKFDLSVDENDNEEIKQYVSA